MAACLVFKQIDSQRTDFWEFAINKSAFAFAFWLLLLPQQPLVRVCCQNAGGTSLFFLSFLFLFRT